MKEADYLEIKGKIVSGVVALTSRTLILQIISLISTLILTILLSPEVFGVFFVISAFISFFSYFSDIGLAAALIQKKDEPTEEELSIVFTIQQTLASLLVLIGILLMPVLANLYRLGTDGQLLYLAFLISFFLSSLKTIPSIILERKLDFNRLIIPQIIETFAYYMVAIILALLKAGILSFALAVMVRGIIGLIVIYIVSPWRIKLNFSFRSAKNLISFGLPFQFNSILALVKDDLMIIFLGKILPFQQIGYIGWAKKWAEVPLRLIMDSIMRVTFPAFSRLQNNKEILKKALEKSLFFLALFIFPATVYLILFVKPIIYIIPKYIKWEPAIFSFYFFAISSLFAAFSSPIINALNAMGKVKITLILMMVWTIMTWVLIPIMIFFYQYHGVAIAALIISFTGVIPLIIMKRQMPIKIFTNIIQPVIYSLAIAILILFLQFIFKGLPGLVLSFLIGIALYLLLVWIFLRKQLIPFLDKLIQSR